MATNAVQVDLHCCSELVWIWAGIKQLNTVKLQCWQTSVMSNPVSLCIGVQLSALWPDECKMFHPCHCFSDSALLAGCHVGCFLNCGSGLLTKKVNVLLFCHIICTKPPFEMHSPQWGNQLCWQKPLPNSLSWNCSQMYTFFRCLHYDESTMSSFVDHKQLYTG